MNHTFYESVMAVSWRVIRLGAWRSFHLVGEPGIEIRRWPERIIHQQLREVNCGSISRRRQVDVRMAAVPVTFYHIEPFLKHLLVAGYAERTLRKKRTVTRAFAQ